MVTVSLCRCRRSSMAPRERKTAYWIVGPDMTVSMLLEAVRAWVQAGGDRSQLKFFFCVENESLIAAFADEEVYVMDRIPIPPLHTIKLGPVNHLVKELATHWDGLKPALASLNITESDYHGGAYEGKQCTQILKKIELVNIPPEHKPFEVAFLALRDLEYMASKVNCPILYTNVDLFL
jgi:hypothetical protein